MTYSDMNEKAIAFGESHLKLVTEPTLRVALDDWKVLDREERTMVEGKPNKASGKTNLDRHREKMAKLEKRCVDFTTEKNGITLAIEKLRDQPESWSRLSDDDLEVLKAHQRAVISKLTGVKTFL